MAIIKSFSSFQNLSNFTTFVNDTNPNSDFFRITEFKETFTGGKNGFLIEGSEFLKETTEVKIEILDVEGNPIYYEPGKGSPDYYEGLSTLVSVHIYPDTPIGIGKITILGELKQYIDSNGTLRDVPEDWKGVYNVKWERTFKINRNLSNEDIVRFYRRPTIAISELVKPIFSKTVPSITQSGSLEGIAIQPSLGSDLTNWRAGTLYKLKITDSSNWTSSVDENIISIPSLGYSPVVKEVLNNKEVLVDIPYSVNNIVQNFTTSPYETTFEYVEGQSVTESALTGSFARINISNLKTFVGDVARVKVFRKSRNEVTDYQFVQESKLESSELLRDVTVSNDTEISYGNFTDYNLSTYWVSSSDDHPLSVNVDVLQASIKTDYNSSLGGVQHLITSESFSISKDVEYTLTFKTLISGSLNGSEYLRGYLSSSDGYQQTFLTVSGSDIYKTRQIVSQNIIANPISASNAHLVFEISGSDWYISNVSLKNAQETSFSPDEFLLIQEIPRKLASETFDFRFEFYDINNNYIPVDVLASATFDGGNDFPTSGKLLTFESDRNAFRFSTGSIQNPENQVVKFTLTQNNLVGTPTFASAAYDVNGVLLNPLDYSQYPGFLTSVTPAGGLLTINNFTGSYIGTPPTPFVGSIVYTASLDGLEEYETVYRLEDGENAPTLIVTSDANQFIYEPTTLSPKPSGQSITIRAQRKNLASYNTPITVNSGSGYPPLNFVETTSNGVTTYTISATEFSASFAANNFDSVKYSFTGSDVFDNQYSDEVTISKVVNFDGVSLVLSNESVTFPATSNGDVIGGFAASSGSVQMFIGGNQIQHIDGLTGQKNAFDIINVVGSGVTPTTTAPTNEYYSISGMSADSGSLTLNIRYIAGDSSTSQSFDKVVSYTKAKKASPVLNFVIGNNNQSATAKSTGEQVDSFQNATLTVVESYNGISTNKTLLAAPTINSSSAYTTSPPTNTSIGLSNLPNGTDSLELSVTGSVQDSEGIVRNVFGNISLSKIKKAAPVLNLVVGNNNQTSTAKSTGEQIDSFVNATLNVVESYDGTSSNKTLLEAPTINSSSAYTIGTVSSTSIGLTNLPSGTDSLELSLTGSVLDSENVTRQVFGNISLTKSRKAPPTVTLLANPQAQTVASSSLSGISAPSNVLVYVNEGGSNYLYETGTLTDSTFKITNVVSGSNNSVDAQGYGTITPTTPSDSTGTSGNATISYRNSEGVTFTGKVVNFSVGVAAQGADGAPGPSGSNGETGKRSTSNMVHYQLTSTSAPSTPSATSYDFSTNTFSGLTSNWSTGAPTYASGNTNKYWYSTYTVTETVAGTGTGTPTFSTPVQAIGFSGLVSFTANEKIGDGTNNLSFGVSGTTLINGDNISTGRIISTNYVTGSGDGFTNTGVEFNLDSGSLAGKNFYLDDSGNAKFNGTITSTAGSIGGWSIGSTTLSGGSTTLSNTGDITVGTSNDVARLSSSDATYRIWVGNATAASAPFRVTKAGVLTASGATISGAITATSGTFTGAVNATSGNFTGYVTAGTTRFGAGVQTGKNGIWMNAGNYWYDSGDFAVGDGSTKGMVWNSTAATLTIGGDVNIGGSIASALLASGDNISSLNNDALYQDNASDKTDGSVGGWAITTSTISAGNGRLVLSNSPYIAVLDTSNNVKVQIRTGALTPLTGGATTTLPSRTNTVSWPLLTFGVTGQAFPGASTTFTPASTGVYSGQVTCGAVGIVASWNTSFSGYINVQAYLQISDNASFSGATNIFLLSRGEYPNGTTSGTISFPSGGSAFWQYNFATTNAHYIRMVWQRTVQGSNIASGVSFSSATATSSASNGSTTINQVELTDEGFQVVSSGVYYFKVAREGYTGVTPYVQVGGDLSATGNVISYYSDKRLKDILGNIDSPLEKIKKLNGVYYKKNKLAEELGMVNKMNEDRTEIGLIAQEVEEVLPEIVHLAPIDTDTDTGKSLSGENYLTIDYTKVVPLLVESIKELTSKVERLEEENKKLRDGDNQ